MATAKAFDVVIASYKDWRSDTLMEVRRLIHKAVPDVEEELKWMGTPVWSKNGILCTGEAYKDKVKLTFMKGGSLPDPKKLFNAVANGNVRRAIDLSQGGKLEAKAFQALILAAVALNSEKKTGTKRN